VGKDTDKIYPEGTQGIKDGTAAGIYYYIDLAADPTKAFCTIICKADEYREML